MTQSVTLYAPARSAVLVGGTSAVAIYGPNLGGRISNPLTAINQGTLASEPLYVSLTGPAALVGGGGTFVIQPGQSFFIPPGTTGNLSVNAATSGHRFSGYVIQPFAPVVPPTGDFPPLGPTTVTKTIPSFLYEQYNDDEDLQAFVDWYNGKGQEYVGWFATVNLALWTGLSGPLLDWIGAGLYGYPRPVLPSGRNRNIGPLNTYKYNQYVPFGKTYLVGNQNYYLTTDDVYKRILTWFLYKGDGKYFTVKWLKRRVMRFLLGTDGTDPNVGDTTPVSITFGLNRQVNINIPSGRRTVSGGALFNRMRFNQYPYDKLLTTFTPLPSPALAPIFKAAVDAGVLELPFQFTYIVNIA